MINPIRNFYPSTNFKNTKQNSPTIQRQTLGYKHSLGVSSVLGLSAMGFGTIFCKTWKPAIGLGLVTAGLSMLFNLPNKIHK